MYSLMLLLFGVSKMRKRSAPCVTNDGGLASDGSTGDTLRALIGQSQRGNHKEQRRKGVDRDRESSLYAKSGRVWGVTGKEAVGLKEVVSTMQMKKNEKKRKKKKEVQIFNEKRKE